MGRAAGGQETLAGRYALERRLGAGGMAEVYLARDLRSGAEVALKLLSPAQAADARVVERFGREAQAAASIDHPNVVAVYDWGADGDRHYIAMEYVPGPNLREWALARGPLPVDEVLRLGEEIATALEAAHRRGVVHLDVKPHNVLLTGDGGVKVADFGIARALHGSAAEATLTMVIGSAPYLSPEQAQGRKVDARSDLYSLGVLLYELLTGRPPFEGDSPLAVALRHLNEPPAPPRQLRPDTPAEVEALLLRALAKAPEARFPDAAAMREAIRSARRGEATRPLPLGGIAATRPLGSAAAAGALGAGAAGAGFGSAAGPAVAAGPAAGAVPRRQGPGSVRGLALLLPLVLLGGALLFLLARSDSPPAAATATTRPPATATAPAASPTGPAATGPAPTRPPPTATAVPPTRTPAPTATATPVPATPVPAPVVVDRDREDDRDKDKDRDKDDDKGKSDGAPGKGGSKSKGRSKD